MSQKHIAIRNIIEDIIEINDVRNLQSLLNIIYAKKMRLSVSLIEIVYHDITNKKLLNNHNEN
jgi:hypothetical protein